MFSLVQLECFVAVAEELHFGRAATRLRMTQPPLSRQIQMLERELGALVLERTSRHVALTPAGEALLPQARRILDLSVRAEVDVRRIAAGSAGTLILAYTAMAAQSALPDILKRVTAESPDVSLVLREMVTTDQLDVLAKGGADIGLLRPVASRSGITTRAISTERLVVALPRMHALAVEQTPILLTELRDERLLMYSSTEARYFHDLLARLFAATRAQPAIVQYASQVPALLALVEAGLGFTLVPASAQRIGPPGVVFRAVAPEDPSDSLNVVELDIAWNDETISSAGRRVLALIQHPHEHDGDRERRRP